MGLTEPQESRGRARFGRWLLALAVVGSALGLGALHTPMLSACAVVAAIATALLWYDAEPLELRPAATMLAGVAVGLLAWSTLQIVPVPRGLLASIAGENADVWSRCLTALREEGPTFATISLDPTASRVQILRGVTYLVVFAGALRVARRQEGVVFLERALVASAVAIAAAALVHPALGARKVFGLYEPGETLGFDPHHIAPLLNMNHLAAYLNIGLLVSVQSVIERRDALPRPLAIVIALLLGATIVWSLSRGGSAAMILGVLLVAMLVFAARRTRRSQLVAPFAAVAAVLGGASVLFLAAFDDTRAKFVHGDLSKIDLVKTSFGLLERFGVLGLGRGAFESTFPQVRTASEYWVNTHPEDVVAQWTTEWGLPVAVLAIVAIAWALRPRTALARSRPPAGAWGALIAVAAHNLVDFSSEVPGVMIALSVCGAIVTGGTGGGASTSRRVARVGRLASSAPFQWVRRVAAFRGTSNHPRVVAIVLSVATVLAIGATLPFTADELYNEQRSFRDFGLDRTATRAAFHARAKQAMLRHPAEPYFPFVGAVRAIVVRDESVLPWAARALERSPVYGRVHLLIARSLFVKNPSQARLEYRLACLQDSNLCYHEEALPLVLGYDDAMELVPDSPRAPLVLSRLADSLGGRLPSTVVRLDRALSEREPGALGPVRRAASAALQDVKNAESWCDEGSERRPAAGRPSTDADSRKHLCVADGLAAAQRLRAVAPEKCDGHALTAELRVATGDIDAGFAELAGALDQVGDRSACARRMVNLAQQTGNSARVDTSIERLLNLGCETLPECVNNLTFAAGVETSRGRQGRGLALTKKAWERAPERDDLLAEIAARAEAQGFHGEALDAYTKLADRHPEEQKWGVAVAREREAVTRSVFQRR
jgi:hypothetical protein